MGASVYYRDINGVICMREEYEERYQLMIERIAEISVDAGFPAPYNAYFVEVATYIRDAMVLLEQAGQGFLGNASLEECQSRQERFFGRLEASRYQKSFLNPSYAVKTLGQDLGGLLSMLYADLLSLVADAYEQRMDLICIWSELFVQIYGCFVEEQQEQGFPETFSEDSCGWIAGNIKDAIYWFYHDYCEVFTPEPVVNMLDISYDFLYNNIMFSDLSDNRYLYQFGMPVGENELGLADYLRNLPREQIQAMARTYTEGYRKGFETCGKDMSKKKTVKVEAPLGFERVTREAIKQFKEMGLHASIVREANLSIYGRGASKRGYFSTSVNRQFDYDHKDDKAYYFDKSFVERRLEVLRDTYEKHKELAAVFGGPAVVEVFGEEPFTPVNKPENASYSKKQNSLNVYQAAESGKITNTYIPGESYSFTIIAYPLPAIGKDFEEIFSKTVELNTLDYTLYQKVQQSIIDVLDQGEKVRITGRGANHTDLTVALHPLKNPQKETIFENCVADVNIPVGEVFTSPVLEGTNGVLHVTRVYLGEFCYKDLEMTFEDGMIARYDCGNFDTAEENQKYIKDNVLHHHDSLPMGEFAIGTNTVAYRMARDYQIADKLPILIAEKTGPHFAVGDTCYSHAEDVPMYNANGKEVVARDNSISLLRDSDPAKAYFNCHTDITIPYDELGDITVLCGDGRELPIIRDGRFVVPGTEILNQALDEGGK